VLQVKQSDTDKTPSDMLRDQGSKKGTLKSTEEIMANGGCNVAQTIYENGEEWHPVLPSHGEQKCIKCRCKVSNFFNLTYKIVFFNSFQS